MTKINAAALALIKENEGLRLNSYQDITGKWTIGYGHTPATAGQTITETEATTLLEQDIATFENAIDAATQDVPTSEDQFSAMVSLSFNIGAGAFNKSTVLRKHRAGDYQGAGDAFLMWDKAHVDGSLQVVAGLQRRRGQERALYLSNVAAQPPTIYQPPPQPVIPQIIMPPAQQPPSSTMPPIGSGVIAGGAAAVSWMFVKWAVFGFALMHITVSDDLQTASLFGLSTLIGWFLHTRLAQALRLDNG